MTCIAIAQSQTIYLKNFLWKVMNGRFGWSAS